MVLSCNNNNDVALEQKIQKLERTNDSLNKLLDTLKTKYIFDNVFVRHVPSDNKSYKIGDTYKGEFYFVAFNDEDRVLFSDSKSLKDADTLSVKGGNMGAYSYLTTVKSDTLCFLFSPIIRNKYALQFQNIGYHGLTISDEKIIKK